MYTTHSISLLMSTHTPQDHIYLGERGGVSSCGRDDTVNVLVQQGDCGGSQHPLSKDLLC